MWLMAGCFAWLKGGSNPARDVKLVIIGLDDAGKTTTIACLQGEPPDGITPTLGFSNANLAIGKWNITIYDLGGGSGCQSVWEKYYAEVYGVIFAVDSGNHNRLVESKMALNEVFKDPKVNGKPIVVFANKQDKDGALNEKEVSEKLALQELSKEYNFKFNVFCCSAIKGYGKKMDKSIKSGLEWLLNAINQDFSTINEKVTKESAIQKELDMKERKERMERIRKLREEREKAAKEAGVEEEEEDSDDDVVVNPFRNIKDQIKVTEKREKKAKEKEKKIKAHQKKMDNSQSDKDGESRDRGAESKGGKRNTVKSNKKKNKNVDVENDEEQSFSSENNGKVKKKKKIKNKSHQSLDESSISRKSWDMHNQSENEDESDISRNSSKGNKTSQQRKTIKMENYDSEQSTNSDSGPRCNANKKKVKRKMKNTVIDKDSVDGLQEINVTDTMNKSIQSNMNGSVQIAQTKVIQVNSKESVRDDTPVLYTTNDSMEMNNQFNGSSESIVGRQNKKIVRKRSKKTYTDEMMMDENFTGVDVKWNRLREKEINDSRAELFRAKSNESLDREDFPKYVGKKHKGKKKNSSRTDIISFDNVDQKTDKKKNLKIKGNKTDPVFSCPTDQSLVNEDITGVISNTKIASRSSKLEPIKTKGRKLPKLTTDEDSTLPSWAHSKPNFDSDDILT